jgi:hypothetical protein
VQKNRVLQEIEDGLFSTQSNTMRFDLFTTPLFWVVGEIMNGAVATLVAGYLLAHLLTR